MRLRSGRGELEEENMRGEEKEIDKDLDTIISERMYLVPIIAKKWKWRILNEYPEDLKNAARAWAAGEPVPDVEYGNISLEKIKKGTGADILNALDLLYIMSKDPISGNYIFSRTARRDIRRR